MTNLTLLIISAVVFTSYNTYVYYRHGLLNDISASYRKIRLKPLFSLFLIATTLPMVIVGDNIGFFISGALIFLVSAAPKYWIRSEGIMHVIGASGGLFVLMVTILISFELRVLTVALGVLVFVFEKRWIVMRHVTYWVEVGITAYIWVILLIFKVILA